MGWKCEGCRAIMSDNFKICEYCGNTRLNENKAHSQDTLVTKQSSGLISEISDLVDPGKSYQSQNNSIKPEFTGSNSSNGGIVAVILVVVVFFTYLIIS